MPGHSSNDAKEIVSEHDSQSAADINNKEITSMKPKAQSEASGILKRKDSKTQSLLVKVDDKRSQKSGSKVSKKNADCANSDKMSAAPASGE